MRILSIYLLIFCTASFANPIKAIEKKVNSTQSWQSDFIQTTNGTTIEKGKLYVEKPGKLRFIYNDSPYSIYADGKNLIYYDENIKQPTYIELDKTPAALLLKNNLKFIDFGAIQNIEKDAGKITLIMELPDGSVINLYFDSETLLLKGWDLKDFQNNHIQVSLFNTQVNQPVGKEIFTFKRKRLA
jgi:outer membrane lipoprotein-sorting protein